MKSHAQRKHRYRRILTNLAVLAAIGLVGIATASEVRAETDDDDAEAPTGSTFLGRGTSIELGAGALVGPAYDGAKKDKVTPYPFIKVEGLLYDHVSITTTRGIAVNLLPRGPLEAGISLGYDGARAASDDPRLRGLSDISTAIAPGAFIGYRFHSFSFDLDVKDRLGNDKGAEATLGARYTFNPIPALRLSVGPSVTFADRQYNQTFFGVTEAEATRATALGNPLRAYKANAGAKDAGLSMTAFYELSDHWSLAGVASLKELLGKDAQSPLTQHRLQPEVGLGVLYKF